MLRRKPQWITLLFIALFGGGLSFASPVDVLVEIKGNEPGDTVAVAVHARCQGKDEEALDLSVKRFSTASFDLESRAVWTVGASADGYWSEERMIVPAESGKEEVRITLWPTTTLRFKAVVGPKEDTPDHFSARFRPQLEENVGGLLPAGEVRCDKVAESPGRWSCEVPAGSYDLRIRSRGFISHFLWSIQLEAGKVKDLGDLLLKPGASIVGWVRAQGGPGISSSCRVTLAPQQSQVLGFAEEHRLQSASSTVSVSDKGFFHFVDVTPGSYVVSASQESYATAEAYGVRVLEGSEATLARDLVMKPPLGVELNIEPPVDPAGRPWVVSLVRQGPETGYKREVEVGPATETGLWQAEQLMPGTYTIVVKDLDDSRWVSKEYELSEPSSSIPVQVPLLHVFGMVVMGDKGVPATLWFGTIHGITSIRMACDEEGSFQGFLPREGAWKVSVQSHNPRVQSTVNVDVVADQELLIPLADTVVQGTVKDVNGAVVPNARVEIFPLEVKSVNTVYTDEEGKFEARGLIGRVSIRARFQRLSSSMESFEISEDENEHTIELVLKDETIIEGVVTTPFGAAMGASVVVIPVGGEAVSIRVINTDASGAFSIGVPATTRTASLTVMAPGYALRLVQVGLPTAGPMLINLQQGGGTLLLELQADPSSRGIPGIVVSEGAFVPVGVLLRWLAMNSMSMTDRSQITVPNVHPGTYSLCSAGANRSCSPVAFLSEGGSERLKLPVGEDGGG